MPSTAFNTNYYTSKEDFNPINETHPSRTNKRCGSDTYYRLYRHNRASTYSLYRHSLYNRLRSFLIYNWFMHAPQRCPWSANNSRIECQVVNPRQSKSGVSFKGQKVKLKNARVMSNILGACRVYIYATKLVSVKQTEWCRDRPFDQLYQSCPGRRS